jgi:hypothetical protein
MIRTISSHGIIQSSSKQWSHGNWTTSLPAANSLRQTQQVSPSRLLQVLLNSRLLPQSSDLQQPVMALRGLPLLLTCSRSSWVLTRRHFQLLEQELSDAAAIPGMQQKLVALWFDAALPIGLKVNLGFDPCQNLQGCTCNSNAISG